MLIPKNKADRGIIMEFKVVRRNETLETAIIAAKKQLEAKNYIAELKEQNIENIINVVIAFEGKEMALEVY